MSREKRVSRSLAALASTALLGLVVLIVPAGAQNIMQGKLIESGVKTENISTEELQQILATGSEPVLDVRSELEYAISHIPGAINIPENEVEKIIELFPDRDTPMILTCNGPFCGKSKRVADLLVPAPNGYTHVRRYQLGLPVWRALGNTVQTDLAGFEYIFNRDETAVFVDARPPQEAESEAVACAVNIQLGEAEAANEDGRLPFTDKAARVVVFADDPALAKKVAIEVAKKAYWSSSYFGGTFADLKNSNALHIQSSKRCRNGMK
jgi:rhodanese-related sulfurtransferase